jgi:hypothetical protein
VKRFYYLDLPTAGLCTWGPYLWRAQKARHFFDLKGQLCLVIDASALLAGVS